MKNSQTNLFKKVSWSQLALASLGLFISVYLLWHHTQVQLGLEESSSFCSFGKVSNCDVVNASRFSEVGGVPLAALGVAYFGVLLILGFFFPVKQTGFRLSLKLMTGLATLALVFDLFLLIQIQWLTLRSFCLLCILTYFANLGHLVGSILLLKSPVSPKGGKTKSKKEGLRWGVALFCILIFTGISLALPSFIVSQDKNYEKNKIAIQDFLEQWDQIESQEIPTSPLDGSWGNKDASTQIVIFSDFQCPFCRKTAFQFHTLLPSFQDKVFVVFKHFPLNPSCNPAVEHNMHPYACSLAQLAVCAAKKERFGEFHDAVFLKMKDDDFSQGWDLLRKEVSGVFKGSEMDECLNSQEARNQVISDVDLGLRLGIEGTPAVFINGRPISFFLDAQSLGEIIQHIEKTPS